MEEGLTINGLRYRRSCSLPPNPHPVEVFRCAHICDRVRGLIGMGSDPAQRSEDHATSIAFWDFVTMPETRCNRLSHFPGRWIVVGWILIFLPWISACSGDNFSQYPGFDAIRAARSEQLPAANERRLLKRHKPEIYIDATAEGPIDFYRDYIAHGRLYDGDGKLLSDNPAASLLNAWRHDKRVRFVHRPNNPTLPPTPTAYGGVYTATLDLPDLPPLRLIFLSYHFVFRYSGLPAAIPETWRVAADWIADSNDWHQLDHYTAVFIILDEAQTPFAVMLQQHNYLRVYFIGDDPAFRADQPVAVDVAIRSNELYPHRPRKTTWRATGFIHTDTIGYIVGVEPKPTGWGSFKVAPDIAHGVRRVDYELQFLPPTDAFYVFEGYLGEHRWLPGRDGPPGAIYRIQPSLWPLETSLYAFYWQDQDDEYVRIFRENGFSDVGLERLKTRFAMALKQRLQPQSLTE